MKIDLDAIYRATLATHSGNEGWVGVAPDGRDYHIVVPVDVQIARGVMAGNKPTDGTPFGGYSNWLYFRCQPYTSRVDDHELRLEQAKKNLSEMVSSLAQHGIIAEPQIKYPSKPQVTINNIKSDKCKKIFCAGCKTLWIGINEALTDVDLKLVRYKANVDDFNAGVFLFRHGCGGNVEIPVSLLVKPQRQTRSLAGLQACPGLCFHQTVLRSCRAVCEGSVYRKLASRIALKHTDQLTQRRQRQLQQGA